MPKMFSLVIPYLTDGYAVAAVLAAVLAAICTLRLLVPRFLYQARLSQLPLLNGSQSAAQQRKTFLESAHSLYLDGYSKVSSSVSPDAGCHHRSERIVAYDGCLSHPNI